MADLWQDRAQLRALALAGLLVSGCCPWAENRFLPLPPSPAPALLLLPGCPQSSFHLISMCGRGGTRRVGKQHSHTLSTTVYGWESYRNMCSAGREESGRGGEGETLRHSNVSAEKQQGARQANLLPESTASAAVLWQSHTAMPLPLLLPCPCPATLASHACVLYTRMLFHLRKCFFSELCPDGLVRR